MHCALSSMPDEGAGGGGAFPVFHSKLHQVPFDSWFSAFLGLRCHFLRSLVVLRGQWTGPCECVIAESNAYAFGCH